MFEIIGLFIATAKFFVLAASAGGVYALLVWLILPKSLGNSIRISIAFLIPIASAAYMWLCVALLPGETLFGDIDQPLPNGYHLKALGKMPDFASR